MIDDLIIDGLVWKFWSMGSKIFPFKGEGVTYKHLYFISTSLYLCFLWLYMLFCHVIDGCWLGHWLKLLVWRIKRSTGFKRGYRIPGKVVTGRVRRSVFGPDAWERRETVGVCNTCLRDAETLNVLGHRPLSHGACGVSLTPVFPFTYGPSEF